VNQQVAPSPAEQARFLAKCEAEYEVRKRAGLWSAGAKAHVEYQGRPLEWIVEKLGVPENTLRWSLNPGYETHVWDGDKDPVVLGLEELALGHSIAVSSGTATGKTFGLGACGTLWYLGCFVRSIVLSIAPKADQLLLNMWKEIGSLFPRFKQHFPTATLLTGKLRMLEGEGEREVWAATAFSAGVGAQEDIAQRLAGFHGPRMLWLVEDAPGVDNALMNTIVNTATGRFNPILAMGNPDHRHDTLGLFAARPWVKAIRISALDHPNVVTGQEIIPGAVTAESIARRLADAGGDASDPIYLSRVRGIAPAQPEQALIRWEWCEAAAARYNDPGLRVGTKALGVDAADEPEGDCAAIARWQGACCTEVPAFHVEDANLLGKMVAEEIKHENIDPRYVGLDSVGVGAGTKNELRRLGIKVRYLSGGTTAIPGLDVDTLWSETEADLEGNLKAAGPVVVEAERFDMLRSQVIWRLREDLRQGHVALPDDKKLFEELTAMTWEPRRGKICVVEKSKVKRILGHSPNKAEACAYGNFVRRRAPTPKSKAKEDVVVESKDRDTGLERHLAAHAKRAKAEQKRIERVFKSRHRGKP
jgi:hypothetical protein